MRGSIKWQAAQIIQKSTAVQIGKSRHESKESAKKRFADSGISAKSENLSKEVGLHSFEYTRDVKATLMRVAFFARENFGIRDLEELTGVHFQEFAERIIEQGSVTLGSFRTYISQMAKCENLLNGFAQATNSGKIYEIRPAIDEMRALATVTLKKSIPSSRAYQNPTALIDAIDNPLHRLGAEIQRFAGFRYYEMGKIDKDQLLGIMKDPVTGEEKGAIRLDPHDTKGGKGRTGYLCKDGYFRLAAHINEYGVFRIDDYKSYLGSLENASMKSGQNNHASHGLRWNFAQERYHELTSRGLCHEETLHSISWEMGHERGNITLHYLGHGQ